jgi:hypothetical protein
MAAFAAGALAAMGDDMIGGGPSKAETAARREAERARRERENWGEQPETRQQRRARERKAAKRSALPTQDKTP